MTTCTQMFLAALFIIAQIGNGASWVAQMVKKPPAKAGDVGSTLGLGASPGEGNSNPIFLPGKSHGQRSLGGYSPWSSKRVRCDLATKQQQQVGNKGLKSTSKWIRKMRYTHKMECYSAIQRTHYLYM